MDNRDSLLKDLQTIRDYVRWGVSRFTENKLYFGHGTDNAFDEAMQLVLHTLHLPLDIDDRMLDARMTKVERNHVLVVIETRAKERIPAAYLNGVAWFAGLRFKVDERVLIPRSPIAELIEGGFQPWVKGMAEQKQGLKQKAFQVLDLCCGSGCIGIATAMHMPNTEVCLSDVSQDALEVAAINVAEYELQERVSIVCSDLFTQLLPQLPADKKFDLIVSNPPYVDQQDFDSMPAEYSHEPELGLKAGPDGLGLVRRILAEAAKFLNPDGVLVVELGNSGEALEEQYPNIPFTWLEFERGGHGVFVLTKQQLLESVNGSLAQGEP